MRIALFPNCLVLLAVVAGCGGGGGGGEAPSAAMLATTEKPASIATVDANALMNWAELTYPQFFPGPQNNQTAAPYVYRYYDATKNYLGVDGAIVRVYGPVFGPAILTVGKIDDFACQVVLADCMAPVIIQSPPNVTVVAGGATTFAADVGGGPSLVYQWQRNGVAIAGATGSSYTTAALVMADNGAAIGVQVSNAKGSVSSKAATLSVVAAVDNVAAQALATSKGCLGCHGIDSSFTGPAYRDVGSRYATIPSPLVGMASSIRNGSNGNWGQGSNMPRQAVTAAEATTLATWILSLAPP